MREHRVHFDAGFILCHDPRTVLTHTDPNEVTCRRCLFFLGRYMPTDPERREELIKRQDKLPR